MLAMSILLLPLLLGAVAEGGPQSLTAVKDALQHKELSTAEAKITEAQERVRVERRKRKMLEVELHGVRRNSGLGTGSFVPYQPLNSAPDAVQVEVTEVARRPSKVPLTPSSPAGLASSSSFLSVACPCHPCRGAKRSCGGGSGAKHGPKHPAAKGGALGARGDAAAEAAAAEAAADVDRGALSGLRGAVNSALADVAAVDSAARLLDAKARRLEDQAADDLKGAKDLKRNGEKEEESARDDAKRAMDLLTKAGQFAKLAAQELGAGAADRYRQRQSKAVARDAEMREENNARLEENAQLRASKEATEEAEEKEKAASAERRAQDERQIEDQERNARKEQMDIAKDQIGKQKEAAKAEQVNLNHVVEQYDWAKIYDERRATFEKGAKQVQRTFEVQENVAINLEKATDKVKDQEEKAGNPVQKAALLASWTSMYQVDRKQRSDAMEIKKGQGGVTQYQAYFDDKNKRALSLADGYMTEYKSERSKMRSAMTKWHTAMTKAYKDNSAKEQAKELAVRDEGEAQEHKLQEEKWRQAKDLDEARVKKRGENTKNFAKVEASAVAAEEKYREKADKELLAAKDARKAKSSADDEAMNASNKARIEMRRGAALEARAESEATKGEEEKAMAAADRQRENSYKKQEKLDKELIKKDEDLLAQERLKRAKLDAERLEIREKSRVQEAREDELARETQVRENNRLKEEDLARRRDEERREAASDPEVEPRLVVKYRGTAAQ